MLVAKGDLLVHVSAHDAYHSSRLSRLLIVATLLASTLPSSVMLLASAFSPGPSSRVSLHCRHSTCSGGGGISSSGSGRSSSYRQHASRLSGPRRRILVPSATTALASPNRLYTTSTSATALSSSADGSSECNHPEEDDDSKTTGRRSRPEWAPNWAPTSLVTMRPILQLLMGLLLYIFHLLVLAQHQLVFPVQIIPNDRGWFQSIGLDS